MAFNSSFFNGPWVKGCPTPRADRISKGAWADLYYQLFQQVYGQSNQATVVDDAEKRLKLLKELGIRK